MFELYRKDVRVWNKDKDNKCAEGTWKQGTIIKAKQIAESDYSFTLNFDDNDGEVVVNTKELLPLVNPSEQDIIRDLTKLTHLNEPGIIHVLKMRYEQEKIYTYSGIVLVALNPYKALPELYSASVAQQYTQSKNHREDNEPHIYAIAEESYRQLHTKEGAMRAQSIIVSGESGAGKTQSAKYIMRYYALKSQGMGVEEQVMATNPIMEAFGNAKTKRNNNSSRFGKYIKILFQPKDTTEHQLKISGAVVQTYLLEKSRVTVQPEAEGNYHIFHYLLNQCPPSEHQKLKLSHEFRYLRNPTITPMNNGEFMEVLQSMSKLGISVETQWEIMQILSGILHLGNVLIQDNGDYSKISEDDFHLSVAKELLKIEQSVDLSKQLTQKPLGKENIQVQLTRMQSQQLVDSLSRMLYQQIFHYLVERINKELNTENAGKSLFIGLLDIYGFEYFDENSFEQLCINYANERLQQQFNKRVFQLEQEEYAREGLQWEFIDYANNQPTIDVLDKQIFALIDEECRLINGSSKQLHLKLQKSASDLLMIDSKQGLKELFVVKHYAYPVEYSCKQLIEKNQQQLSNKIIQDLQIQCKIIKINIGNSNTVGKEFRQSLSQLIQDLDATDTQYIRCIKSNNQQQPMTINQQFISHQLIACGVLETIRISQLGYPTRLEISQFQSQFRPIIPDLKLFNHENDFVQIGKTKVYLKSGQLAKLQHQLHLKLFKSATLIQKNFRRFSQQKKYEATKKFIFSLQLQCRQFLSRKFLHRKLQQKSALVIQKNVRRFLQQQRYEKLKNFVVMLQNKSREFLFKQKLKQTKVIRFQAIIRGFLCRKATQEFLKKLIKTQSIIRRRLAKKEFRKLKQERLQVQFHQQKNNALELKLMQSVSENQQLRKELEQIKREMDDLKRENEELKKAQLKHHHQKEIIVFNDNQLKMLRKEFIFQLIQHLILPPLIPPQLQSPKQILFPSILLIKISSTFPDADFTADCFKALHAKLSLNNLNNFDELLVFWLSNLFHIQQELPREQPHFLRVYKQLLQRLKQVFQPFVNSLLDNQSLNNYITPNASNISNNSFMKWLQPASSTAQPSSNATGNNNIEQLLQHLQRIDKIFMCFYLPEQLREILWSNSLQFLFQSAFNQLMSTQTAAYNWKRGLQLQYNITRIDEWLGNHDLKTCHFHLEPLLQCAKFMQLNKLSLSTVDDFFEICFLLNRRQLKQLLSSTVPEEYSPQLLRDLSEGIGADEQLLFAFTDLPLTLEGCASVLTLSDGQDDDELFLPQYLHSKVDLLLKFINKVNNNH